MERSRIKHKMSRSPLSYSKAEKRKRFTKRFIKRDYWQDEDLLGFIADEFDNNVEDIDWILKTALKFSSRQFSKILPTVIKSSGELRALNDLGKNLYGDCEPGFTYFHVVCKDDCARLARRFVEQGVDPNLAYYSDGRKKSPLSLCIEHGKYSALEFLLENGADMKSSLDDWAKEPLTCLKRVNRARDYWKCAWKIIADRHFDELLRHATTNSVKIENRSDDEGFTYLHAACLSGNEEMVRKFIDQRDDLDVVWRSADGSSESPLTLATELKRIEMIKMLLRGGADPNLALLGKNPLHVFFKHFENVPVDSSLLDLLIGCNCDVNGKDNNGQSPLFLCFESCKKRARSVSPQPWSNRPREKLLSDRKNLETLLENGADVNEVFAKGQSILHLFLDSWVCQSSTIHGNSGSCRNTVGIEFIETLLKHGVEVNAKDDDGDSPLQLAVTSNNLDAIEVLLAHGADLQGVDFSRLGWRLRCDLTQFDRTIKFIAVLDTLHGAGYKMSESSRLSLFKFLVDDVKNDECNYDWRQILGFGSTTKLRSLLADVENIDARQFNANDKRDLARIVHQRIQTVEQGNIFIMAETRYHLELLQQFFARFLEEDDICRFTNEISMEIENLKKLKIKDDVSLFDVCSSRPDEAYYKFKKSKLWTVIDSKEFQDGCKNVSNTVKVHIIGCFVRKLFKDIGLEYLTLLTHLPVLCCEKLTQYLSYEDVMSVCRVYVKS
ncbi:hypothetical protein TKK_0003750 [Trichogramma kaykai]